MKKILFLILMFTCYSTAWSQNLKFHENGEFKIVQFTDVHYNGTNKAKEALDCIDSVMTKEQPDLVVVTGDILWGKPAKKNFLTVLNCIAKYGKPWVIEFGNHDFEEGLTNRELYEIARSVKNNILPDLSNEKELDFTLSIKKHNSNKTATTLYLLDSHAYPKGFPEDKSHGTYAWLTFDQVEWYRKESQKITAENSGKPIPALAFFHIPLPEYHEAAKDENAALIGTRREEACSPIFNTGMFTAMMEAGDIMAIFVGHDHDNDYAVMWHDILLGYGRYSGGNTVYNHLTHGARVIILKENRREFDTYIREINGSCVNHTTYPTSWK